MTARGLSEAEVEAYRREGWAIVKGMFDSADVSGWIEECDRLWGSVVVDRSNPRVQWRKHQDGVEVADRIDPVLDISPAFAALVADARLVAAASRLLDGTAAAFKAKLITKRPGTGGYGLHQDYPYWAKLGLAAAEYVNALVPFDPFDAANGSPEMFPGLHHAQAPAPPGAPLDTDESVVAGRRGIVLELAPGDVVLFHSLVPHRSGPNLGERPRRGLFLTYVPSRFAALHERYERERVDRAI
jgi:ectoine hydroxylase-related dioxygenase (phytanoyl-CoA dioxygenase family)